MAQIDTLFKQLVALGGSDLHLSSGRKPLIRESGEIMEMDLPILDAKTVWKFIEEIMPVINQREFDERHDTEFAYENALLGRFRANVFRNRDGTGGVFRVIPTKIPSAEQLNLPKTIMNLCSLNKGLVVVTGPTGSGKSTTLATMIDYINQTRTSHIITIEDPIEFVHKDNKCLISQREVHNHTQSFSAALRAALREDPDIVFVGEMRDLETIELALHVAETGHLVLTTLHTNTAVCTVDRIIDAFPSDRQNQIRNMLASSLKGVVSQTLCKRKLTGRVAALEIMVITRGISAMIRDGKTCNIPSAMQIGGAHGMVLLNDALTKLVRDGIIEPQEAYGKAVDKEELFTRFAKLGYEIIQAETLHQLLPLTQKTTEANPAVTEPRTVFAPEGKQAQIDHSLTICNAPFECCPLQQVILPEEPTVYVVLGVDEWGSWNVLDAGQTDQTGDELQAAERQSYWIAKCPSRNLWFGLHMIKGSISRNRLALEDKIRAEHKLDRTQKHPAG